MAFPPYIALYGGQALCAIIAVTLITAHLAPVDVSSIPYIPHVCHTYPPLHGLCRWTSSVVRAFATRVHTHPYSHVVYRMSTDRPCRAIMHTTVSTHSKHHHPVPVTLPDPPKPAHLSLPVLVFLSFFAFFIPPSPDNDGHST